MAPEIITGNSIEASFSVDVWSLGCILYELLIGERLFQGKREEIIKKVLKHNFSFPSNLTPEALNLLEEMMKNNMTERISVEGIINHPWLKGENLPILDNIKGKKSIDIDNDTKSQEKTIDASNSNEKPIIQVTRRSSSLDNFFKKKKSCHMEDQIVKKMKEYSDNNIIYFDPKKFQMRKERSKKVYKLFNKKDILPTLITKIPEHVSENTLYEYNLSMLKNNQDIPSYLQPIGHNKTVKQKLAKIKNFFQKFIRNSNQHLTVNISEHKPTNFMTERSSSVRADSKEILFSNKVTTCKSESKDNLVMYRPRKLTTVLKTTLHSSPSLIKLTTPGTNISRKKKTSIYNTNETMTPKKMKEISFGTLSSFGIQNRKAMMREDK